MSKKSNFLFIPILIFFAMISCQKDTDGYISKHRNEILSISADKSKIEADGKSFISLAAKLSKQADKRDVVFRTSNGVFENNLDTIKVTAYELDGEMVGNANLTSSLIADEMVKLRVTVPKIDTIVNLKFDTALPDSINVESSIATIKNDYGIEIPLKVYLLKSFGRPSLNQKVFISVYTASDLPFKSYYFKDNDLKGSNENGLINTTLVLKDKDYVGIVSIKADLLNNGNSPSIKSNTLEILLTK